MQSIEEYLKSLRALASPLTAFFIGTIFTCTAYGLLSSYLALRLNAQGVPTNYTGIILAVYYVGYIFASLSAYKIINRVGHIRAFSAYISVLSALVLLHALSPNPVYWGILRLLEGYCLGSSMMCLESWLNTRSNNQNRGVIMSMYMITTYLGSACGQLMLNIPDPQGFIIFIVISVLYSVALVPISLTALPSPDITAHKSMSLKRLYGIAPVGVIGCIVSGVMVGSIYTLGAIYAERTGLSMKATSLFMFFTIMGGMLAQFPLGKLSDLTDRRYVLVGIAVFLVILAPVVQFLVLRGGAALVVVTMLLGAGTFTLYPISVSHVNDLIDDEERINASGMLILAQNIGLVAGPIVVSAGMSLVGSWFFPAAFAIIPILFILFTLKMIKIKPDINYLNVTPTQMIPTAPANTFNELVQNDALHPTQTHSDNK